MTTFKYAAKDSTGKTVEGMIDAEDRGAAIADLRAKDLVVLDVQQGGKAGKGSKPAKADGEKKGFSFNMTLGKPQPKTNRQELVLFTRQLATMIGAGLSLLESLDVLGAQAETPGLKLVCEKLTTDLRGGSDLSTALAACPKAFTHLYVSMVSAGEVSGQMDVILERLADYQEASDHLTREIKSAMTYPVISMFLVLGITTFLMLGVVPTFRGIFESLDAELPAITQFVLGLSDFMRRQWMVIFGGMGAVIFAVSTFKKTKRGQLVFDHIFLKLPVFGVLFRKVCLARFSRTFATLIRSGVPIMGTLDIVADTAGNEVVARAVREARESVKNGNMLSEPLSEAKVFPPMVVRMIAIGERSGALEQLLEKIAEFYDQQVQAQVKALTSMIEPLLISFMGVIVGGVVLAIFMPILNVVGELGGG